MVSPRTARLVLSLNGDVIGALPPLAVETPWWQDIAPVVRAVRDRFGLRIVVLRLLSNERLQPPGGEVTYLAELMETAGSVHLPLTPWPTAIDDQALRASYARPGGPAADLAWAMSALAKHSLRVTDAPEQIRTWNLSSVWRLPVSKGAVWLKVLPTFMTPEGPLLTKLAGAPVPTVLGHDGWRCLLADIPGRDLYDAEPSQILGMVTLLVELQARWLNDVDALLTCGIADWRHDALVAAIADVVERTAAELPSDAVKLLSKFVAELPGRFQALATCGLPDTLVHGDFHPGNFRGDGADITLLDWGEGFIGHPLLDQSALLERVSETQVTQVAAVERHWEQCWQSHIPHCDPRRAARLLMPVATARRAMIYRRFLDHIEPAEHPYHRTDPRDWLLQTAALLHRGDGVS